MQAEDRLSDLSVIQCLLEEPHRFQFVQAVRVLLRWLGQNGISYDEVLAHVLRIENSLSLNFPVSEIVSLSTPPESGRSAVELLQFLKNGSGGQILLVPGFFGLLGVSGSLPLRMTESIAEARHRAGDAAPHAFVNLLSQRLMVQYFRAWAKNRLEHALDLQGTDGQLPLLMALTGIRPDFASRQPDLPNDVIGYYAALLATRPVAANSLSRVLTRHFDLPIELEPFVANWDVIPPRKRSKLGTGVSRLGYGAALGARIWRRDTCVRLKIGPLCLADLERFLPGRPSSVVLSKMVALFGLGHLKVTARIMLQSSCIQRLVLTSTAGSARRLGWDAFLVGRGGSVSRTTMDYLLREPAAYGQPD